MAHEYFKQFEPYEWESVLGAIKELIKDGRISSTMDPEDIAGVICQSLHGRKPPEVYDKTFGDSRQCVCGHSYYRHFDGYEDNKPVGCKYACECGCEGFKEGTAFEQGVFAAKVFFKGDSYSTGRQCNPHARQSDRTEWERGWDSCTP
jgi:hypothetical protein